MSVMEKLLEQLAEVAFVDLRFTDTFGIEHHISVAASVVDQDFLNEGKMFDGSSIHGWRPIDRSDMVLKPDLSTAVLDPFSLHKTLLLRCDVLEPGTTQGYDRCPRAIAKRAMAYLHSTGIADRAFMGPEPEFFIFDDVRFKTTLNSSAFYIDSEEGIWNSDKTLANGNLAHRPGVKGGYFPVSPVDSSQDLRCEMANTMTAMGLVVEAHHHEVATANQNEICVRYNDLVEKADEMQLYKYVVKNVAHAYGKSATFMPKPLVGDNGNGMHVHQSLFKDGVNLFQGDGYGGLSQLALYYIGGIIKHARALNAFTNPATNSYKRLVPGFEAPVMLAYSSANRSAAIRIPYSPAKARRIEVRFPDPLANPYLAFSAMMLAGLDGILNKISPGEARDYDLYDLSASEAARIPSVCHSLSQALDALQQDHAFLTVGGVFSDDFIKSYIDAKMLEVQRLRQATHPIEFELYYAA